MSIASGCSEWDTGRRLNVYKFPLLLLLDQDVLYTSFDISYLGLEPYCLCNSSGKVGNIAYAIIDTSGKVIYSLAKNSVINQKLTVY